MVQWSRPAHATRAAIDPCGGSHRRRSAPHRSRRRTLSTMFTGIVGAIGKIVATGRRGDGLRLVIDSSGIDSASVAVGDSIAVNGCCLTVVAKELKKEGA